MAYVEKTKTWKDNWNDTIRYVFFRDEKLRQLMMIPAKCNVLDFIKKYFVEDLAPDEVITNEAVRIAYYDSEGKSSGNQKVRCKYKEFDIYVKQDHLHDATDDRLQNRCHLIAERLKYLLLKDSYVCRIHYEYEDDYDLWTKMIGYKRYHIVFTYKISV